jgi:hypothetical protein
MVHSGYRWGLAAFPIQDAAHFAHAGLAKAVKRSVTDYTSDQVFGLAIAWCIFMPAEK